MSWIVRLSRDAARQLRRFPPGQQEFIRTSLRQMQDDPFRGDVIPLKGRQWHGRYRKRVGRYRLIFVPNHAEHIVEISAILLRDEHTYR
jgi:mRNA-degrading endonuclease RelE of RelBE toxin-antitoxin system